MRPAKVSATTASADSCSTIGCSPIGSAKKSLRFVLIPHDNNDRPNRRIRQLADLGSITKNLTPFYGDRYVGMKPPPSVLAFQFPVAASAIDWQVRRLSRETN